MFQQCEATCKATCVVIDMPIKSSALCFPIIYSDGSQKMEVDDSLGFVPG
jgi:hypothetical protein